MKALSINKKKKTHKVLLLFSGGLDSRLAIKILQKQKNLEIVALNFILPFGGGCCNNQECIINYSQVQGVKLFIKDCTSGKDLNEYLEIIKHPKHGRGTAMNPCKDCKIFMLKKAKEFAKKIGADIIATGEVRSQRPMSQLKHQLELTERKSGLFRRLLRPLSAKLLPETIAEKEGWIDRNKLLDLHGRQRTIQMQLAKKYKIKYPTSGGGCLLCEKGYVKKLKPFLKKKKINTFDIEITKIGRHFNEGEIILGKNLSENQRLEYLNKTYKKWNLIIPLQPGPYALFKRKNQEKHVKSLMNKYSKHKIAEFKMINHGKTNKKDM